MSMEGGARKKQKFIERLEKLEVTAIKKKVIIEELHKAFMGFQQLVGTLAPNMDAHSTGTEIFLKESEEVLATKREAFEENRMVFEEYMSRMETLQVHKSNFEQNSW